MSRSASGRVTRGGWLVGLLCLLSLLDVGPVRRGEQFLAALVLPFDGVVRRLLPDVEVPPAPVADAEAAWAEWVRAVADRPPPADRTVELLVVAVEERREERRELVLRVPDDAPLALGSPVTHRGHLLGFVVPWSRRGEDVVSDGRVRVGLLGHPRLPAVAADWRPREGGDPVPFLLAPGEDGPRATHLERDIDASLDALVVTRDVRDLGVDLVAGLSLGRFEPGASETPGGGVTVDATRASFVPLVEADELSLVTIEAPLGARVDQPLVQGRLVQVARDDDALLVDRGTLHGLRSGDPVVQDGRWVGSVRTVGPTTAVIERTPPVGALLVEVEDGQLEALAPDEAFDRAGRRPGLGRRVFGGHPRLGGVFVGHVSAAGHAGFEVELPVVDPDRPVVLVGR